MAALLPNVLVLRPDAIDLDPVVRWGSLFLGLLLRFGLRFGGLLGLGRRLGGLLLARRLEDFEDISRNAPRVVVYPGTNKLETRLDRVDSKGYAVGFQGLVGFIMEQLPQSEIIESAIRKENKLVPEIAIRELVANALIHQDFGISGASMIVEIYSNRKVRKQWET